MTAEEYMKQYRKCRLQIKRYQDEIQELEDLAGHITSNWSSDKVQSSHPPDKLGAIVARISDLKEEQLLKIGEASEVISDILDVIDQVSDPTYQTVLSKRYVACLTWEVIGERMDYDPRWAWELNNRALREVEALINGK